MNFTLYVDSLFASPWAMSTFVAMKEKQLDFGLKTLDLEAGAARIPAFRDFSMTARVPALVHGDFVLTESTAIQEYLEELFPVNEYPALYPKNSQDRARARQLQAWMRSDFQPLRAERDTEMVFFQKPHAPLSEAAQAAAAKLVAAAERLIQGSYLFDKWCVADLDLAMMLQRLITTGEPVPEKVAAYANAQFQRPAVQQWLAFHQPA